MIRPRLRPLVAGSAVALLTACLSTTVPAQEPGEHPDTAPTDLLRLPEDRPLRAGFLVVDGIYNSELMAPYDILHHTVFHTRPGIEVMTISPDGEPVTTFEGIVLDPHHGFESAPPLDILVVPSAEHSMDSDLEDERMIGWVRETGKKARFVMSLCDGAFVLARAGLLNEHAATTFPDDQKRFAQMFPEVELRINVSFVHDGRMITSVGGAKSYDPAMYLVDLLYGEKVAQRVGHGLLIDWPPGPGHALRYVSDRPLRR